MERINPMTKTQGSPDEQEINVPSIFGLRYLEEEAAEIHDIVGCMVINGGEGCYCDDHLPPP